ncbi:amidohydrolase family protein [Saccharopolyspora sp. SCSIO 74807]|uniref:amidohydrolase family protein n=1 Tax=Saccharopolyspora sp. SCSIO 74807 TaxID=3118084 RepID=UPI0030D266D7
MTVPPARRASCTSIRPRPLPDGTTSGADRGGRGEPEAVGHRDEVFGGDGDLFGTSALCARGQQFAPGALLIENDTIAAAVEADFDTIEHCTFLGRNSVPDLRDIVAKRMVASGIAASPALPTGWRQMWEKLGPQRAESIAHRLRWLTSNGVPLIFGSDAGVPISQHGDPVSTLELYEHIGFSNADILELATTTSAHHIGLQGITGALRPGHAADILAVHGNPVHDLQALRNPVHVLQAGKEVLL